MEGPAVYQGGSVRNALTAYIQMPSHHTLPATATWAHKSY